MKQQTKTINSPSENLSDYESALLKKGIRIAVNDGINFLCVMGFSFLFHDVIGSLLWLLTFVRIRTNAGGWHAMDRIRCFLAFQCSYLSYELIRFIDPGMILTTVLFLASVILILQYAPVEHVYNPLTPKERIYNRQCLKRTVAVLSLLYVFLLFHAHESCMAIAAGTAVCFVLILVQYHSRFCRRLP